MYILAQSIHCLFPVIALIALLIGIRKNAIYYIISALWLSIISLIIHFQSSGSQILGSYFNYLNSAIYTINLLVLFVALFYIIAHLYIDNPFYRITSSLLKAFILIASVFVIINLWTNAYFIENRMPGTPIMQVALFKKADYCSYKYVFYKVAKDGSVLYLCPNHYGLIPSVGKLAVAPEFIIGQLSVPVRAHLLMLQKKSQ